jgi:hypothetical protein
VRSFFGAELVEALPREESGLSPTEKADLFLEANREHFKLDQIDFGNPKESHGAASLSVRYEQRHNSITVYGAQMVVGLRSEDGAIVSTINAFDYELPISLRRERIEVGDQQAVAALKERFKPDFANLKIGTPTLYVYRHVADQSADLELPFPDIRGKMLSLSTGTPGRVYLVWQILMQTEEPDGSWELLVDATNGKLTAVKDRRSYSPPRANIWKPDPIRSSMNQDLHWGSWNNVDDARTLNTQLKEVFLENLDLPPDGIYRLNGLRIRSVDKRILHVPPPETLSDFIYGAQSYEFLSVMAYYYLDRLITDLREYGIVDFNTATEVPIEVDAQGSRSTFGSFFLADDPNDQEDASYILLARGDQSVPAAQDPGVIAHEYGHAIHHLMDKRQDPYAVEHWLCDFLAVAWVDRYNETQYLREEMFPWHNNKNERWATYRRVDLKMRFDDQQPSHDVFEIGVIGATALWHWFNIVGGDSTSADDRKWAANEVIRTYMDTLVLVTSHETRDNLFNQMIQADANRTGCLHEKAIWDAFRERGHCSDLTRTGNIDLYVRDSQANTGDYASRQFDGNSPDIWVRNNRPGDPNDPVGENPDEGHQPPINNQTNYVYVRIHNRGLEEAAANTFWVDVLRCSRDDELIWPADFSPMGTLPIATAVPADGSVRIGPFLCVPPIADQECLLAIVRGPSDPTIADRVKPVDHRKLVRFDNNVGKRNVENAPP